MNQVYCCKEHGQVTQVAHCENHGHHYDSLYPKSVYYCSQCDSTHGTSAVNGAVSWQCMKCWSEGRKSVPQVYVGRNCIFCGYLDKAGAQFELLEVGCG